MSSGPSYIMPVREDQDHEHEDDLSLIQDLEADVIKANVEYLQNLFVNEADTEDMELGAFHSLCLLLQPPTLSASSLSGSLGQLQFSLFSLKRAIAVKKDQVNLLDKRSASLSSTLQQVRQTASKISTSLSLTSAEVDGVSLEELVQTTSSYQREIDAEKKVYESLTGMIGVYSGEKLVEGMKVLKERREELREKRKILHFAPTLPPSISGAKAEILLRKEHLTNLLDEIDAISG